MQQEDISPAASSNGSISPARPSSPKAAIRRSGDGSIPTPISPASTTTAQPQKGSATTSPTKERPGNYKPIPLRLPFLSLFLLFAIAIFALLEWTIDGSLRSVTSEENTIDILLRVRANSLSRASATPTPTQTYVAPTAPGTTGAPFPGVYTDFRDFGRNLSRYPFGTSRYFLAAYLPTLLAVIFTILWDIIYANIVEMEPFFSMTSAAGATWAESMQSEYRISGLPVILINSCRRGKWSVLCVCLVSVLLKVGTPLATVSLYIGTEGVCDGRSEGDECHPYLALSPVFARIVEVVLALVGLATGFLIVTTHRRSSGLYAEATSIAGIAVLVNDVNFVNLFRTKIVKISSTRLRLEEKNSTSQAPRYGISAGGESASELAVPMPLTKARSTGSVVLRWPALIAFALVVTGLNILIIYYNCTGQVYTGFEIFMDSQGNGPRIMMTVLGILIKSYWDKLDIELRSLAPYRLLLKGHAKPSNTILQTPQSHPIIALFSHNSRLLTLTTFTTLLSEILVVTLSGIPFSSAQSYTAFKVSVGLSVTVLTIMLITLLVVISDVLWKEKREALRKDYACLGLRVKTIADVVALVYRSKMLEAFEGFERLDEKKRRTTLVRMEKRYKLGEVMGRDGAQEVMVDEDEEQESAGKS